jgi:hypothetical protein
MNQKMHNLEYAPREQKSKHSILEILTLSTAILFMGVAFFVHFDFRPDRQWLIWRLCFGYGWLVGLAALSQAVVCFFRSKKRILYGIIIILTIFSFIWFATFPVYR